MKNTNSKYQFIFDDLRDKLLSNHFRDGKLPSLHALTECYNVSLMTVNKAVKMLEQEGIVCCNQGRLGTVLNQEYIKNVNLRKKRIINTWNNTNLYVARKVNLKCICSTMSAFDDELQKELICDFEKKYPWIKIQISLADDFVCDLIDEYDIFQSTNSYLLELQKREKLFNIKKYHSNPYSFTILKNMPLLFFDKNIIQNPPKNYQEFIKTSSFLQENNLNSSIQIGLFSLLHHFSGNIREIDVEKLKSTLELLALYHNFSTPWNNFDPVAINNAIRQKNITMLVSYINNAMPLLEKSNYQVSTLPSLDNTILAESIETGVLKSSKNRGDALLWCKYLLSTDAQRIIVKYNMGIPQNEVVFENEFKAMRPKLYKLIKENKKEIIPTYISAHVRDNIYMRIYPIIENFCIGNSSIEETLEIFIEYINELLLIEEIL